MRFSGFLCCCCSVSHCSNKPTIKIIDWSFLCQLANVQNHEGIKKKFPHCIYIYIYIYIYTYIYCDESVASPLIISISPSLIRRPSPGSRREWVCERGGALKQPGLAACDEAHTWSEWSLITAAVICRVRLSSGDRSLPRACTLVSSWVQEGSVEGATAAPVHGWRARMPGRLIPGKCRGPRGRRRRWRSRRPSHPGPQRGARAAAGLRPFPGPFLPEHCPSFTTRAAQRGHQIPCFFWTLHPLWTLYFIISVE